jgi:hypothetical protein
MCGEWRIINSQKYYTLMPQRERDEEKTGRKEGKISCRQFLQMNGPTSVTSVTVGAEELVFYYERLDGK